MVKTQKSPAAFTHSPILCSLVFLLLPGAGPAADDSLERAKAILARHPLIDGHNDLPWAIRENAAAPRDVVAYDLRRPTTGHTDLARLRRGGVGGQFWSVYVPPVAGAARLQLEQIDIARRVIARYPEALRLAGTADEVEQAMRAGLVASLLGMEGGHAIENSLGALRAYHELGVRYMTLTHSKTLDWADSATDQARHGGLTRFGEEVVREMNRLGMLVDLSHVSPATMADALRVGEAPVIFSHSSARALCDHPRNVPDDILRALPANGGIVMVTFVNAFVSGEFARASAPLWKEWEERSQGLADPAARQALRRELAARMPKIKVTLAQVADHVEHVRTVAGVEHVGLGGDYDGNDDWPEGMGDVSSYPQLVAELLRRGWSEADLARLASGNLLRVMRQAEAVARRLQQARPASLATIEELDPPSRDGSPTGRLDPSREF
jgi:membrane dipeptidase